MSELVYTTDDIDDIGSVIQLSPHKNSTFLVPMGKTEDNDNLYSIDEVYEKTGQEAIGKVVEGFKALVSSRRLKKEHGVILGIKGAENWIEPLDRANAVMGGEGFIKSIIDGFVKLVKAIIKFIKNVCNWITLRVKALLGFERTHDEVKFLHNKTKELKTYSAELFSILGIHGFDPRDLIKEFPDGLTTGDMLRITAHNAKEAKKVLERLPEIQEQVTEFKKIAKETTDGIKEGKRQYNALIAGIRDAVRNGTAPISTVTAIKNELPQIALTHLNPDKFRESYKSLITVYLGVDLRGIGVSGEFSRIQEEVRKATDGVTGGVAFNKELYEAALKGVEAYTALKNDPEKNRALKQVAVDYLKKFVDDEEPALVAAFGLLAKDPEIESTYMAFVKNLETYTRFFESTLRTVQDIEFLFASVTKACDKMEMLATAYATENIGFIRKRHEELTEKERAVLEGKDGNLLYFKSLNDQFYAMHPDGHVTKNISDKMNLFFRLPPGIGVLKATSNFLHQYRRRR